MSVKLTEKVTTVFFVLFFSVRRKRKEKITRKNFVLSKREKERDNIFDGLAVFHVRPLSGQHTSFVCLRSGWDRGIRRSEKRQPKCSGVYPLPHRGELVCFINTLREIHTHVWSHPRRAKNKGEADLFISLRSSLLFLSSTPLDRTRRTETCAHDCFTLS